MLEGVFWVCRMRHVETRRMERRACLRRLDARKSATWERLVRRNMFQEGESPQACMRVATVGMGMVWDGRHCSIWYCWFDC